MNSSHGKKSSPLPLCLPRSQASGAPQGRLFPPHRVALGTRRQLSLALQPSLPTSARACDIHCAPLPAPPPSPQCAPVRAGMPTLAPTWVWEDRNPGPLESQGAPVTRSCPCPGEPHRGNPNSCSRSGSRCTGRARPPHPSLRYLSFVHLPQVSKDVQAGRGEMCPHGARAYHGGVSGGPGDPPAPSVTHSCGAPAGPAHRPASRRAT